MNKGQIEQIGTPEQVYKQPRSAFVANFLGDVNILHGYILAGVLHIDTFNKPIEQCSTADDVVVYVRPHEIAISKTHKENSLKGIISRVHTAGPTVF
ncbi:ABC-type sulfate/molybdate transport systems, ATPase component [Actinobacillus equuli]|nr:ABC-type sulfate/molybdate transport systems, ATPase component [Actinobacillus equuli]